MPMGKFQFCDDGERGRLSAEPVLLRIEGSKHAVCYVILGAGAYWFALVFVQLLGARALGLYP